jgi:hypothetical protein
MEFAYKDDFLQLNLRRTYPEKNLSRRVAVPIPYFDRKADIPNL